MNPLIKANILDPNMKVGLKIYILASHGIFKILSPVHEQIFFFCGENDIGLLFTFQGTELALKICKKLSLVQNDLP